MSLSWSGHTHRRVSIPRSGFWVFKLVFDRVLTSSEIEFQSLGRDSGCSSLTSLKNSPSSLTFQSLGRDSGCSSGLTIGAVARLVHVSIPRSGFWVFKPTSTYRTTGPTSCFNPSVGILGVQARSGSRETETRRLFQSLGRDSGCSSHLRDAERYLIDAVSIPRSGFWVFKRRSSCGARCGRPSFNPSVGILGVQATTNLLYAMDIDLFQSLGRDSGCSSLRFVDQLRQVLDVSIPRSGFWVFKHRHRNRYADHCRSFNPSVGILGVQATNIIL